MEPEFRKTSIWLSILAATIVIAVFGLYFYFNGLPKFGIKVEKPDNSNQSVNPTPSPPSGLNSLPPEQQLESIIPLSKTQTEKVSQTRPISISSLPSDILNLSQTSTVIGAQSVVYATNAKGFEVEFKINKNAVDAYRSFSSSFDNKIWHLISGAYSEKAGALALESNSYRATIQFIEGTALQSQGKMMIIVK